MSTTYTAETIHDLLDNGTIGMHTAVRLSLESAGLAASDDSISVLCAAIAPHLAGLPNSHKVVSHGQTMNLGTARTFFAHANIYPLIEVK